MNRQIQKKEKEFLWNLDFWMYDDIIDNASCACINIQLSNPEGMTISQFH